MAKSDIDSLALLVRTKALEVAWRVETVVEFEANDLTVEMVKESVRALSFWADELENALKRAKSEGASDA